MSKKLVTTRIREHYVSDNGEWLYEKGKVKEARLLKEICVEHEDLRKVYRELTDRYNREKWDDWKKQDKYDHKIKDPLLKQIRELQRENRDMKYALKKIRSYTDE